MAEPRGAGGLAGQLRDHDQPACGPGCTDAARDHPDVLRVHGALGPVRGTGPHAADERPGRADLGVAVPPLARRRTPGEARTAQPGPGPRLRPTHQLDADRGGLRGGRRRGSRTRRSGPSTCSNPTSWRRCSASAPRSTPPSAEGRSIPALRRRPRPTHDDRDRGGSCLTPSRRRRSRGRVGRLPCRRSRGRPGRRRR
jgi:hypothetical protein